MKKIFFKAGGVIGITLIMVVRFVTYEHHHQSDLPASWFETRQTIRAQVVENPDSNFEKNKYRVRPYHGDTLLHARLLVTDVSGESVAYGDVITFTAMIKKPEPFTTESGRTFEYDNYLQVTDSYGLAKIYQVTIEARNQGARIKKILFEIRNTIQEKLITTIPYPESGLLAGILLGHKTLLSPELVKNFQIAGLSHVMVLSGYNITLIITFVTQLSAWLGLGYRSRRYVAMGCIPLFIIMTGFGASSVRAGIMATLMIMLQVTTRPQYSFRVLIMTALIMIFHNPRILLYDPSFHLSMLAFIGLVYTTPVVAYVLRMNNMITETLAVQITVMPYLLWSTGSLSIVALAVNIITVPFVPYIMLLGGIALLVAGGVQSLGVVLGIPATFLLKYMIYVVDYAVALPWSHIAITQISGRVIIVAYAIMIVLLIYYNNYYVSKDISKITNT